jgi:lysophospholipase L1-like esterase
MNSRFLKLLIVFSITFNLLFISGTAAIIIKKGGMKWVRAKWAKHLNAEGTNKAGDPYLYNKMDLYDQLPVQDTDIVILGDDSFEFGEWHELMGIQAAKNRSMMGADTHTILNRLDQVIGGKPRHIVLRCGINNFQKGSWSVQSMLKEYKEIVDTILSGSENTDIWLIPVFPVNTELYRQRIVPRKPWVHIPRQEAVHSFNQSIASLQNHARVHFCDMPGLLNEKGELSDVYTLDGLHLNYLGLQEVADMLKDRIL